MTKREFDQATKLNYGTHYHGATDYRRNVRLRNTARARDYVWERCCELSWRNQRTSSGIVMNRDGFLPTLAMGSRFRAPQTWRAKHGLPLLERAVTA